jgi:hypothetical protein
VVRTAKTIDRTQYSLILLIAIAIRVKANELLVGNEDQGSDHAPVTATFEV